MIIITLMLMSIIFAAAADDIYAATPLPCWRLRCAIFSCRFAAIIFTMLFSCAAMLRQPPLRHDYATLYTLPPTIFTLMPLTCHDMLFAAATRCYAAALMLLFTLLILRQHTLMILLPQRRRRK